MWNLLVLLADEPTKQPTQQTPFPDLMLLLPVLLLLFWLIVLRPANRRQEQDRQALITGLKKNDKVLTSAGIYGTVVAISEKEDEVTVKVDDNTRLRMTKASIHRNLSNEEAARAQKEAKEAAKSA